MRSKLPIAVLCGFLLMALAACGGGGDGARITDLEADLAAAEEAREQAEELAADAELKRQEEEAARKTAEAEAAKAKEAEEANEDAVAEAEKRADDAEAAEKEAEQEAEQARQEADRRIEEAETQANVTVRAPLLITELTGVVAGDEEASMDVRYTPGERRTFTRPSNLPAKGSAPSVPGSWSSASYSGPRGNVGTDTVYLYTNIQAPGSKAFWKEHGESVADSVIRGRPDDVTLTVSGFGMPEKMLLTDNSTGKVTQNGTYDGYSGKFTCETGCNIATGADTDDLSFTGVWTFTASLTAKRTGKQAEQDTEYLYFGIWAYEPTDAAIGPDFKWAAGGETTAIVNFGNLTGTAEFTGGAVGKYALAKVGGRAAKIGTFTANATFTADFDDNMLSGRLTAFKEGGSDLGSDWNVFLGATPSTAAALAAPGASGTTHGAIDGDTAAGTWAATLHGSGNADMTEADGYTAAKYPRADVAGVAGWFNAAAGTNAAIAGAFGAACTTGTMCAK